jgi:hypothetical protein
MTKEQNNSIKIIAAAAMLIDHIGFFLFPENPYLRILGRIAFPLFAYCIAAGAIHTKDFKGYITRLFILAAAWQPIHACLCIAGKENYPGNVIFTLVFGLICIKLWQERERLTLAGVITLAMLTDHLGLDIGYGFYGILTIMIMYLFYEDKLLLSYSFFALNTILLLYDEKTILQFFSIISILFIVKPIDIKIKVSRDFFYWFYPAHLLILIFVTILLQLIRHES